MKRNWSRWEMEHMELREQLKNVITCIAVGCRRTLKVAAFLQEWPEADSWSEIRRCGSTETRDERYFLCPLCRVVLVEGGKLKQQKEKFFKGSR